MKGGHVINTMFKCHQHTCILSDAHAIQSQNDQKAAAQALHEGPCKMGSLPINHLQKNKC
jgi:hypothetical protein